MSTARTVVNVCVWGGGVLNLRTGAKPTHVVSVETLPHRGGQVELAVASVVAQHVRQVIALEAEYAEAGKEPAASAGLLRLNSTSSRHHPTNLPNHVVFF